jgi:hypothetical protein
LAVSEFVVISPQSNGKASRSGLRTWNGGAANTGIEDTNIKDATYFIVEAESTAEAVSGVRQLYPGSCAEKLVVVKKSSTEEK